MTERITSSQNVLMIIKLSEDAVQLPVDHCNINNVRKWYLITSGEGAFICTRYCVANNTIVDYKAVIRGFILQNPLLII